MSDETTLKASDRAADIQLAHRIDQALEDAFSAGAPLPNSLRRYLFSIQAHAKKLREFAAGNGVDADIDAERAAIRARAADLQAALIKSSVPRGGVVPLYAVLHAARGAEDQSQADSGVLSLKDSIRWQEVVKKYQAGFASLKEDLAQVESRHAHLRRRLKEAEKLGERLDVAVNQYAGQIQKTTEEAKHAVNEIVSDLRRKQEEVNELVGLVSGTAVAGSYAKSAETERRLAEATRNGSVLLMLVAVLILGYSLFETTRPSFEWQTGAFRLLFSLALSVPAAYLARESTKHRTQQYAYLRVSMDLQSITPYLASLPEQEQHRLKAEIAGRLFAGKDTDVLHSESYPLNVQELVMALVSRIGADAKDTKNSKKADE